MSHINELLEDYLMLSKKKGKSSMFSYEIPKITILWNNNHNYQIPYYYYNSYICISVNNNSINNRVDWHQFGCVAEH